MVIVGFLSQILDSKVAITHFVLSAYKTFGMNVQINYFRPQIQKDMSHSDSHDHDEKPEGFLNTVFDSTMGGFGIVWVSGLLICVLMLMLFG